MGHVGSWRRAAAGAVAHISATVFGESISARGATAGAPNPELPIPAAGRRSATDLSGAGSTKRARAVATRTPGSASGEECRNAGSAPLPPAIVSPAKRSGGSARTTAASGGRRCSKARNRAGAYTSRGYASEPAAATAAGPAPAAGAKGARPGKSTARQATHAGSKARTGKGLQQG